MLESRSAIVQIYSKSIMLTTLQHKNSHEMLAWSVIITIAQWLDIFSSKISRHLNFEKKSQQFLRRAVKTYL
jgi:hypothetical protein